VSFAACVKILLQSEGGFVDDPEDPGGATNLGVDIHTLSGELGRPATVADVKALTVAQASDIYLRTYYNPAHCGDLPDGVDLMVFDAAINSGQGRAIRLLQSAVGVDDDGAFGPATLAAVRAMAPKAIIDKFHDLHAAFYAGLPTYWKFGGGWDARNDRTRSLAIGMIK